jgi:hypothetical protein
MVLLFYVVWESQRPGCLGREETHFPFRSRGCLPQASCVETISLERASQGLSRLLRGYHSVMTPFAKANLTERITSRETRSRGPASPCDRATHSTACPSLPAMEVKVPHSFAMRVESTGRASVPQKWGETVRQKARAVSAITLRRWPGLLMRSVPGFPCAASQDAEPADPRPDIIGPLMHA